MRARRGRAVAAALAGLSGRAGVQCGPCPARRGRLAGCLVVLLPRSPMSPRISLCANSKQIRFAGAGAPIPGRAHVGRA